MGQKLNPLSGFFDMTGEGSGPVPPAGDTVNTETRTVTITEATNKYLVLQYTPKYANQVSIEIEGAVGQFYGSDYTVTSDDGGKRLSWVGLGLDGLISMNDKITIIYVY